MRKRSGGKVYGPYPNRRGVRFVVVSPTGARRSVTAQAHEADDVRRDLEEELASEAVTVNEALDVYEDHLVAKGNAARSIETTMMRLRSMFPDGDLELVDLTAKRCAQLYTELRARPPRRRAGKEVVELDTARAADTHRNTLGEARTFVRWCTKRGWVDGDPMGEVEGVGRRRRGKAQLRLDEAKALLAAALDDGGPGALAASLALLLAMRSTEIISIVARDVDDGGRLLWIPKAKSELGRRVLEVPDVLTPIMAAARTAAGNGPLFPGRDRRWVRTEVQRLCRAAGVPVVSAHGLRGTHSSIAADAGATGRLVAGQLGHTEAVNRAHYTQPDAAQRGQARRAALRLVP